MTHTQSGISIQKFQKSEALSRFGPIRVVYGDLPRESGGTMTWAPHAKSHGSGDALGVRLTEHTDEVVERPWAGGQRCALHTPLTPRTASAHA